jgi:hypothetical protein
MYVIDTSTLSRKQVMLVFATPKARICDEGLKTFEVGRLAVLRLAREVCFFSPPLFPSSLVSAIARDSDHRESALSSLMFKYNSDSHVLPLLCKNANNCACNMTRSVGNVLRYCLLNLFGAVILLLSKIFKRDALIAKQNHIPSEPLPKHPKNVAMAVCNTQSTLILPNYNMIPFPISPCCFHSGFKALCLLYYL